MRGDFLGEVFVDAEGCATGGLKLPNQVPLRPRVADSCTSPFAPASNHDVASRASRFAELLVKLRTDVGASVLSAKPMVVNECIRIT